MKSFLPRAALGALCITGALGAASLPASAAVRHHTPHVSAVAPRGTARGIESATDSSYLAGYTVTPSGGFASVGATFKVPAANCTKATTDQGIMLGVGNEPTVGSPTELAGIFVECLSNVASYDFEVFANGNNFVIDGVNAGDTIVASYYQTASTVTDIVHDLTAGVTWIADAGPVPDTTATVGAFPLFESADPMPVPNFKTATFSKCQLDGDYLGFASPTQTNRTNGSIKQITTSVLPVTSDTFTLTYKHS